MPHGSRSIITLTTDFGTRDFYVGAIKGAILRHAPDVMLVDMTHDVPRHDVRFGSVVLERALAAFGPGVVHLAVVDPGVGTSRRMLIARWPDSQLAVCPDNGLLNWAWRRRGPAEVFQITWRPDGWRPELTGDVFHGRDIMGPVAAMLAAGTPIDQLGRPMDGQVLLDVAPAVQTAVSGEIITGEILYLDHYGNATTTIPAELVQGATVTNVRVERVNFGPIRRAYGDVGPGEPLALVGSSGLVEVAVGEGSAGELGVRVGDRVVVGSALADAKC